MSDLAKSARIKKEIETAREKGRGVPKHWADPNCLICHGTGYVQGEGEPLYLYCECRYQEEQDS